MFLVGYLLVLLVDRVIVRACGVGHDHLEEKANEVHDHEVDEEKKPRHKLVTMDSKTPSTGTDTMF